MLQPALLFAQYGAVSGKVVALSSNQALAFVTVVTDQGQGTLTDENGAFTITDLPAGTYNLVFSCIGYETGKSEPISVGNSPVNIGVILLTGSAVQIDEITVTEQQKVYDTRYAGTNNVISLKKIKELQPIGSEEMLRTIPGVNIAGDMGLSNRPNISIRGSDPRRSNKILLMEDGSPISPAPYLAPGAYYNVPSDRLEGIQVIKGPETLVYGANNIFGVVNYITRKPISDPAFNMNLTGGQRNYFAGVANYGGSWNNTGAEFMAMYKHFDGFTDNAALNMFNFSGKWFSEITKTQSLYLKLVFQIEDVQNSLAGITPFTFETDPTQNPFNADLFSGHRYGIDLIHNWKTGEKSKLQSKIYGSDFYRDWWKQNTVVIHAADVQSYVGDAIFSEQYSYLEGQTFGTEDYVRVGKLVNGRESATNSRWAYQVAGLQERFNRQWKQHNFEAGGRLHFETYHDISIKNDSSRWARSGITIADLYYDLIAPSAYVKNTFLFGNWEIIPIARYEFIALDKNDLLKNGNDPNNSGEDFGVIQNNFSQITPGLNITYKNMSAGHTDLDIYASAYQGYSSPTTAIAFITVENGEVVPTTGDETNIKPETSINTEIGTRFVHDENLFNGQVAVFNMLIDNFYSPARAQAFETLGSVRISGLEFAYNMQFKDLFGNKDQSFLLGVAFTAMRSEITSGSLTDNDLFSSVIHTAATEAELIDRINTNPEGYEVYVDGSLYAGEVTEAVFDDITKLVINYGEGKVEGYDVPYVPAYILNANVNYKLNGFSADLSFNYTGEQYTDFFNMENESGDGSIGKLPAYYYLNANLNYTLHKEENKDIQTSFFIAGKNLTNEVYRASRLNRATGGLFPYGFMQVNAGVSLRF